MGTVLLAPKLPDKAASRLHSAALTQHRAAVSFVGGLGLVGA